MPDKRPTDNMELAVDLPQEEEFALANMMPYTYYNFWFLPEYQQEYADKIPAVWWHHRERAESVWGDFCQTDKDFSLEYERNPVS